MLLNYFIYKKEEKVIVEIPISEELKELIKRNFNVNYDGYKIFHFDYFLENLYCFLLKNKENNFLALIICKNCVDSISTISIRVSNTMEFGNTYFKNDSTIYAKWNINQYTMKVTPSTGIEKFNISDNKGKRP